MHTHCPSINAVLIIQHMCEEDQNILLKPEAPVRPSEALVSETQTPPIFIIYPPTNNPCLFYLYICQFVHLSIHTAVLPVLVSI